MLFPAVASIALMMLSGGTAASSVQGLWLTDDRKGIVRIAPCGARLCGTIARVLDTDRARPTTDRNNPDPRLRGRPILPLDPGAQSRRLAQGDRMRPVHLPVPALDPGTLSRFRQVKMP